MAVGDYEPRTMEMKFTLADRTWSAPVSVFVPARRPGEASRPYWERVVDGIHRVLPGTIGRALIIIDSGQWYDPNGY